MRARISLVLAIGLLMAADDKADTKEELRRFQGSWVLVSGEKDGKKISDEHVKKNKMTYQGEQVSLESPHQSAAPIKSTIKKMDPSKTPAEMDWVRSAGPGAGQTMMAIYQFNGIDQCKVCFDPSGKARPKEFATKEGTGHILHVWKRVAEKPK